MRWIVGDLQGCALDFETILREIRFDPGHDELWCAGDLVNRGPESAETLRLWRSVGGRGVLGNHDVYALCARTGRWPRKADTLDGLYAAPDADELLEALRALPLLVHLPSAGRGPDVWLVHAGLHPAWSDLPAVARRVNEAVHDDDWLECPDVSFATRVRCCLEDGQRVRFSGHPADRPAPYEPWDAFYRGDTLVVHGHWVRRGYYRGPKSLGLDSGCVYGGPLTAWCQDEDRVVQVPARSTSKDR